MSTQQIIQSWENGVEPYRARNPDADKPKHPTRQVKVDRFGKPISRYFTTSGFPRLRLWREMEKARLSAQAGKGLSASPKQKQFPSLLMSEENKRRTERNTQ